MKAYRLLHVSLAVLLSTLATTKGGEVWLSSASPANTTAAGTPSDPYKCPDGASLQTVLAGIPQNSTIHFMPGTFLVTNWIQPQVGWKIRGAGIDNTILKLLPLGSVPGGGKVAVIGGIYGYYAKNGVEVSDMTIDCNLQNQTVAVASQAVQICGNNTRISRVHAINWGTTSHGYECFVFAIWGDGNYNITTNCVIEDCVVDTPAPVTHADGTTAISLSSGSLEVPGYPLVIGGEVRGNLVCGITKGAGVGQPAYLNAYGGGPFEVYVHDNRAINLPGGTGYYQDTWSGNDVIIARNVFDNIGLGIYFDMEAYHDSRVKMVGNTIMPASAGVGISIYTGQPGSYSSNGYVKNLIIKDNTIHPANSATNTYALMLNGVISASVINNILDGGTNGSDVAVAWNQLPSLNLSTFIGNYNLNGTAITQWSNKDYNWHPAYEDIIKFTPGTGATGWYRVADAISFCSGKVELFAPFQGGADNTDTDLEFAYRIGSYTTDPNAMGTVQVLRQDSNGGGAVTQARIGSNYPNDTKVYLDLYVARAASPQPITVVLRGFNSRNMYTNPQLITTAPPVYHVQSF